jgi:hypothetical protein
LIKWLIQSRRPIKEEVLDAVDVEEEEGAEVEILKEDQAIVEDAAEVEEEEVAREAVDAEERMKKERGFLLLSWDVSCERS